MQVLPTYIRDSIMNSIKDFVSFLGLGGVTELEAKNDMTLPKLG